MDRGDFAPLRSLPRAFVEGVGEQLPGTLELPAEENHKFRKVLRLAVGAQVAILPGDGRLIRCRLEQTGARPLEVLWPDTEAKRALTIALGIPKPDKLDESVRVAAELGVSEMWFFPADRTVVRWDEQKRAQRLRRLNHIAREACEVCFRVRLPRLRFETSLEAVLAARPDAQVLSEVEAVVRTLDFEGDDATLVIGPEGGWSPQEVARIGDRAVTLGPRVLRVDTAVAAACALALL